MSSPFASASEVAEFSGVPVPADLSRLQALLDTASAVIRAFCRQTLSSVTGEIEVFRPTDRDTLILRERPVISVTALTVGGVAFTDYWVNSKAGLVVRATEDSGWPSGATVTYNHGYAEGSDGYTAIKGVCIEAALRAYTLNERSASTAMGSTLMESAGYAPEVFLTDGEKRLLSGYGAVMVG